MRKQKKSRLTVTRGQIFLALVVAAIALTAVFEIGVSVGKKRVIEAEQVAAQQNNMPWRSTVPASDEEAPFTDPPSEQATEAQKPAPQNDTPARAASQIPTGGEFPVIPPQKQPPTGGKAVQYTVQVGTFSSYQSAEDLVALLKSYEYKSWLRPEPSTEQVLYSVFVGGFDTRDEAKQFGNSLRNRLLFVTDYVVREIQE